MGVCVPSMTPLNVDILTLLRWVTSLSVWPLASMQSFQRRLSFAHGLVGFSRREDFASMRYKKNHD